MTDIQYWDDTLSEEIEAIQQLLDQVQSMGEGADKSGHFDRVEKRLRAAQGTKRSFKMETRLVADVNQRRKFENRLQRLDQQLNTLQADCKALRQEHERGELFDGEGGEGGEVNEEDAVKAGDNMLKEAERLQEKTQDSLGNTKQLIAQSKEVGMSTLEELERQRDVLNNIEKEIDRVDDGLARAEALLKQFGKRMAGDKFIQCFAVLNFLLLGGVIIYTIVRGKGPPPADNAPGNPLEVGGSSQNAGNAETRFLLRHHDYTYDY